MFKVEDGGEERVRVLDTRGCFFHVLDDRLELCEDQDSDCNRIGAECPGCKSQSRRSFVVCASVFWRGALDLWEIRHPAIQDALAVIEDLTNRDIIIKRRGTGLETTYSILPVEDARNNAPVVTSLAEYCARAHRRGNRPQPVLAGSTPPSHDADEREGA